MNTSFWKCKWIISSIIFFNQGPQNHVIFRALWAAWFLKNVIQATSSLDWLPLSWFSIKYNLLGRITTEDERFSLLLTSSTSCLTKIDVKVKVMASLLLGWRVTSPWLYYYTVSGYCIRYMACCYAAPERLKLSKSCYLIALSVQCLTPAG